MSRPGMAVITVQFDVGVKYNDAVLRLYDTVHSHRDWLAPNLGVHGAGDQAARHRRCADRRADLLDARHRAFGVRSAAGGAGDRDRAETDQGNARCIDHRRPGSRHSRADGQRADERLCA
jgi:hypothetical protein